MNGYLGNDGLVNLSLVGVVSRICGVIPIDYLAIGHITQDIVSTDRVTGGTVAYAGRTAAVLGCKTAVFSSASSDFEWQTALPNITVHTTPSPTTTTFENIYTDDGRIQYLHQRAQPLTAATIPLHWQRPFIVHFAPVANEIEGDMIPLFGNSLIGMTPQGWLRQWDKNGRIAYRPWEAATQLLPLAGAVILSEEDLPDTNLLTHYRSLSQLLVLTQGENGCTVYTPSESRHIPAPSVTAVESTGAGDVFAAAFLVRLWQTEGNVWEAAHFANKLAAQSVTQVGLPAKMDSIKKVLRK